ncbi:hypothetical protein Acr_01g0009550 [Actinidia rufa]|uniref:Uncharacterized protein n=1 Tax=Actinidia rufa TaxID=165716 RepID=A0A7J0E4Q1_9ERIC|nr:hypothetical protein Acr_01g0009550 [Actinidia rufa]
MPRPPEMRPDLAEGPTLPTLPYPVQLGRTRTQMLAKDNFLIKNRQNIKGKSMTRIDVIPRQKPRRTSWLSNQKSAASPSLDQQVGTLLKIFSAIEGLTKKEIMGYKPAPRLTEVPSQAFSQERLLSSPHYGTSLPSSWARTVGWPLSPLELSATLPFLGKLAEFSLGRFSPITTPLVGVDFVSKLSALDFSTFCPNFLKLILFDMATKNGETYPRRPKKADAPSAGRSLPLFSSPDTSGLRGPKTVRKDLDSSSAGTK